MPRSELRMLAALGLAAAAAARPLLDADTVAQVNADPQQRWQAELSPRFAGMTFVDAQRMLGVTSLYEPGDTQGGVISWAPRPHLANKTKPPPTAFDARVHWNGEKGGAGFNCSTMVTVEDQGGCGSCWAFGSSEAFSDRTCVGSEGKIDVLLSPQEPTSCVGCMVKGGGLNTSCGYNGCGGGQPHTAWEFFAQDGLVDVGCCAPPPRNPLPSSLTALRRALRQRQHNRRREVRPEAQQKLPRGLPSQVQRDYRRG